MDLEGLRSGLDGAGRGFSLLRYLYVESFLSPG